MQERNAAQELQDLHQYLTFTLGGEAFAMDILHIKEIIEYGGVTEVPLMPSFVRGVINLRGAVVPVIDLSVRFGRQPTQIAKRTCIVIIEVSFNGEMQDIGVIVDAVNEVLDIPGQDIEPAPAFGSKIRSEFILGMGKVNQRFVIVLDVNQVLSLEEMSVLVETDVSRHLDA
nr:chemotaxis protein CheW [Parachitinimonas caeni]